MPETPVLTSWKEIAAYLGKGVRTVQRWEGELRLPVRRPYGMEKHVVVALPDELDRWVRERLRPRGNERTDAPSERHDQLERLHRLLNVMVERTRLLQQNVASLRENTQDMVEKRRPLQAAREARHAPDGRVDER